MDAYNIKKKRNSMIRKSLNQIKISVWNVKKIR